MQQPTNKTALLEALRREEAYWRALLDLVSEEDMQTPGVVDDWTFKDVLAHLTGWRKRTVARFAGAARGTGPLPPDWPPDLGDDVPRVNAWIYETNHDRPLPDVLAESGRVWRQLVEAVAALPESDLFDSQRFAWMGGQPLGPSVLHWSYGHLHEHAAQIDDWLARSLE